MRKLSILRRSIFSPLVVGYLSQPYSTFHGIHPFFLHKLRLYDTSEDFFLSQKSQKCTICQNSASTVSDNTNFRPVPSVENILGEVCPYMETCDDHVLYEHVMFYMKTCDVHVLNM